MIDRIVLFKLKDELTTDDARREVAGEVKRVIASLPGVKDVRVGLPADEDAGRSWDVSLIVRFASHASYEAYRDHDDHAALIESYLGPRLVIVKAWNFEAL